MNEGRKNVLVRIEHVVQNDTATCHVYIHGQGLRLGFGLKGLAFFTTIGVALIGSGEFPHQGIATIVAKVNTGDVCIVQSAGAAGLFAVATTCAIERRCLLTSASMA